MTNLIISLLVLGVFSFLVKLIIQSRTYKLLHMPRTNMESFLLLIMQAYKIRNLKIKKGDQTWEQGSSGFSWNKEVQEFSFSADRSIPSWQLDFILSDLRAIIKKEEYEQAIEASSKLAALGEVAAGIAHEINNPLAIVHGKATICGMLLEEEQIDSLRIKKEVEDIVRTAERMDKIINSLRYFVRDDKRDPLVDVSTKEILDHAQVLCVDRCRKQNTKLLVAGDETTLLCKPTQISQVLVNLVSNALDAIKDQEGAKWIRVSTESKENCVVFVVEDSGKGIPKEVGEQILNSFYTTKKFNKTSGLGMGLNIAKRIIEAHFGKISIDYDSPNTKFIVKIPRTQVLSNTEGQVA